MSQRRGKDAYEEARSLATRGALMAWNRIAKRALSRSHDGNEFGDTADVPPELPIQPRHISTPRRPPLTVPQPNPSWHPLDIWSGGPPPGYLGQLDQTFQSQLAERWSRVQLEECYFYHYVRLPDGNYIAGPWDLIDNESEYLGGIHLDGRTVIEFGPATGWLTFWMTQHGADVVALDLGWDLAPDLLPLNGVDFLTMRTQQKEFAARVINSWWYLRRQWGHSARAVYAPIYDLPADIGQYHTSVFGSILMHLRDPFRALEQGASVTTDTMVVVERLNVPPADVDKSLMLWNPTRGTNPNGWWFMTPTVVADMLAVVGFPKTTISYNRQIYLPPEAPDSEPIEAVNFTVVGRRK